MEPDEHPGWNTWRMGRARREAPAIDADAASATAEDMLGREWSRTTPGRTTGAQGRGARAAGAEFANLSLSLVASLLS